MSNVKKLTPYGGYFIISVLGDGHLTKGSVQFKFRKRDCGEFRDIICYILNITPPLNISWRKPRRRRPNHKLSYDGVFQIYSTELVKLLANTYGIPIRKKSGIIRIPRQLMDADDQKIHGAVMRACYECEGGVNLNKKSLCVVIGNTSELFLQDFAEILDSYNIDNKIYDIRLKISSLKSIIKFFEIAYSVFDLKLHIAAKKAGLETLIKHKSKKSPF